MYYWLCNLFYHHLLYEMLFCEIHIRWYSLNIVIYDIRDLCSEEGLCYVFTPSCDIMNSIYDIVNDDLSYLHWSIILPFTFIFILRPNVRIQVKPGAKSGVPLNLRVFVCGPRYLNHNKQPFWTQPSLVNPCPYPTVIPRFLLYFHTHWPWDYCGKPGPKSMSYANKALIYVALCWSVWCT